MNTESLEMIIDKTQQELAKRPARKNITMFVIALILFLVPLAIFFNQPDNVYKTAFAPIVAGWLMTCVAIGHVVSSILILSRSVELELSLETSKTILALAREKESNE